MNNEIKPAYWGKLKGRPNASHVRELGKRASAPCPSGNGQGCPTKDLIGRVRNDAYLNESEIKRGKYRKNNERRKIERSNMGGSK